MLHARGYIIEKETEKYTIFKSNQMNEPCNSDSICLFNTIEKMNVSTLQHFINNILMLKIKHAVIIYTTITPVAKKIVENSLDIEIEIFEDKFFNYNIIEHRLVPRFEKLSETDKSLFIKRFGRKIPKMLSSDPISRYYNYSKNDIIKIIRNDSTVSYRIVM
jgi:DNA-directed RNA polymerase I, II, and III subunit RPABC1